MNLKWLSFFLFLLMLFPLIGVSAAAEDASELSLYVINVRKADALLLRSGSTAYLIDTGSEDSFPALLKALREEGINRLDGVILTHTHSDHAGGLSYLLDSDIAVDQVYASGYFNKKEKKHPAVAALKGTGREVVFLLSGDTLPLDGGTLEVLGPLVKDDEAENNNSLVLLASGGGGTMLLTGDMEFPEEETLLSAGLISHADVLKIANHGESDATGESLVAAVSPSVAVISTNSDDEPDTHAGRVIKLLKKYGIPVYLTEETESGILVTLKDGKVTVESR